MKIAIIGTRGIPNNYGGFEQCAEYLAVGLFKRGFDVAVYNSHNHPYQERSWNGVQLIHQYDPESMIGTAGQFIYDLNCILDCRKRNYDIILQLGYTSNSVWGSLLPSKRSIITTNMDGLEWKRSKYSKFTKRFLLYAEKLAVTHSHHLISDSIGIQNYLKNKYGKDSVFIPYGADPFNDPDLNVLSCLGLSPYTYNLLIARLEPENSIEIILDGVVNSGINKTFLVVGGYKTKYGNYIKNKYKKNSHIKFVGGIYDIAKLNNLRYFSNLYFHGHTVGGTNPSLLEAMASHALICAHDNVFNRSILGEDALYFNTSAEVAMALKEVDYEDSLFQAMIQNNLYKINSFYKWERIVDLYIEHFDNIKPDAQLAEVQMSY